VACSRSVRSSCVAVVLALVASCDGAITLEIAGDRPIPRSLDAICVGVADTSESGGHLGQLYRLSGELSTLPQTLRIQPGDADSAYLWVRGDLGGAPITYATVRTSFEGDARIALDRCAPARAGSPSVRGAAVGPADARLVVSHGSGNLVVAFGAEATILDAKDDELAVIGTGPPLPAGNVVAVIAADIDGDCDDDLVIATDGEAPIVWRRNHRDFTPAASLPSAAQAAIAAADVDHDGDTDLVTGIGSTLSLWYNDGSGKFTLKDENLKAMGRVSSVRALALGDVNVDGNADLLVGQAKAPMTAWLGGTSGLFEPNDGVIPPVPLDVASFTLADADGDVDLDLDLAVSVKAAPMKLYIDREGQLEDQSFVRLPMPPPTATAIALAGWDEGRCEPDALVAGAETLALHGDTDAFTIETMLGAASGVVMIDLDEDGDLDAILATPEGVRWLAR
jgi:FG-GAP-like repeat